MDLPASTPHRMANEVTIDHRGLIIDGWVFPWYLGTTMRVERADNDATRVTVELLVAGTVTIAGIDS